MFVCSPVLQGAVYSPVQVSSVGEHVRHSFSEMGYRIALLFGDHELVIAYRQTCSLACDFFGAQQKGATSACVFCLTIANVFHSSTRYLMFLFVEGQASFP